MTEGKRFGLSACRRATCGVVGKRDSRCIKSGAVLCCLSFSTVLGISAVGGLSVNRQFLCATANSVRRGLCRRGHINHHLFSHTLGIRNIVTPWPAGFADRVSGEPVVASECPESLGRRSIVTCSGLPN
jgi:hypothetical protein